MPVALHNLARAANAVEQMNKRRRTSGATLPCLLGGWVGEIGGENDEMEVDGECCDDEDELEEECGEGEEGEEGDEEIEECDEEDGEGGRDDDGDDDGDDDLPWDPWELREMVVDLKVNVKSWQQAWNGSHKRADHVAPRPRPEGAPAQTEAQAADALRRRQERGAQYFRDELQRRSMCRVSIINRLALDLTVTEREELRGLGFLKQEWFLATRSTVAKLQEHLYSAVNSLEIRLSEHISVPAFRRMRRVLTTVQDAATGKWVRFKLMDRHIAGVGGEGEDDTHRTSRWRTLVNQTTTTTAHATRSATHSTRSATPYPRGSSLASAIAAEHALLFGTPGVTVT